MSAGQEVYPIDESFLDVTKISSLSLPEIFGLIAEATSA